MKYEEIHGDVYCSMMVTYRNGCGEYVVMRRVVIRYDEECHKIAMV